MKSAGCTNPLTGKALPGRVEVKLQDRARRPRLFPVRRRFVGVTESAV